MVYHGKTIVGDEKMVEIQKNHDGGIPLLVIIIGDYPLHKYSNGIWILKYGSTGVGPPCVALILPDAP